MADLLIRNVDDEVVRRIDATAERQGLSRNEYLRREMGKFAQVPGRSVTVVDLQRMAEIFVDIDDDQVMDRAWR